MSRLGQFSRLCLLLSLVGAESFADQATTVSKHFAFSTGYTRPVSKQGASDGGRLSMSPQELDARYRKLKSWGTAFREYNFWWSGIEASGLPSSDKPLSCPDGYTMIPADAEEKTRLGFLRYRCANQSYLDLFDDLLRRDQAHGMQSAVVMWSSPEIYRYKKCGGFKFADNSLTEGCVPRDDAMDDFEDYANLLASRYNGSGRGKISHFIVWNESASPGWFDYSPVVNNQNESGPDVEKRLDKYADMMKRVHNALARHQRAALLYVSTDMNWEAGKDKGHYGSRQLLEGLWNRLGVKYSWSVAVHPYDDVDANVRRGTYTFKNLEIVTSYQESKLRELGISNKAAYPQSLLLASEQGWSFQIKTAESRKYGREYQARQICLAHEKIMQMPSVVAVGHNYFHSNEDQENRSDGRSGQGAFYGLIPFDIPNNLDGAEHTATGKAFMSTMDPALWRQSDNHYCCQTYNVGCVAERQSAAPSIEATHTLMGHIDGVAETAEGLVVRGWACMRSMDDAIEVQLYAGPADRGGTRISSTTTHSISEPAIQAVCKSTGQAHRFEIPLDANFRARYLGHKLFAYGLSPIGDGSQALANSGRFIVP